MLISGKVRCELSSFAKKLAAAALASTVTLVNAQTAQQRTVIENTVALNAAQTYCGYRINFEMLGLVLSAANLRTTDLQPGGKYWKDVQRNQSRVRQLVTTDNGKTSFCRNVRRDLSAMFD